ncbi:MAG: hypothetical protein ACREFB_16280 [Stellaceae bacterium]
MPRLPLLSWRAAAGALAFLALGALTGCGGGSGLLSFGKKDQTAAACPSAVILHPLANTAIFSKPGMGMRPTDVRFYGILSEIDAKCDVQSDALHVSLAVIIAAERGPATRGNTTDFTYFLAVVGPGNQILSKRSFGVRVDIPQNAKRAGVTDHFDETIPLGGRAPSALRIIAGFQQTPQDVDFYQHFRGR